jgi:hypothetical protein
MNTAKPVNPGAGSACASCGPHRSTRFTQRPALGQDAVPRGTSADLAWQPWSATVTQRDWDYDTSEPSEYVLADKWRGLRRTRHSEAYDAPGNLYLAIRLPGPDTKCKFLLPSGCRHLKCHTRHKRVTVAIRQKTASVLGRIIRKGEGARQNLGRGRLSRWRDACRLPHRQRGRT